MCVFYFFELVYTVILGLRFQGKSWDKLRLPPVCDPRSVMAFVRGREQLTNEGTNPRGPRVGRGSGKRPVLGLRSAPGRPISGVGKFQRSCSQAIIVQFVTGEKLKPSGKRRNGGLTCWKGGTLTFANARAECLDASSLASLLSL